jgi:hypothetical protein
MWGEWKQSRERFWQRAFLCIFTFEQHFFMITGSKYVCAIRNFCKIHRFRVSIASQNDVTFKNSRFDDIMAEISKDLLWQNKDPDLSRNSL